MIVSLICEILFAASNDVILLASLLSFCLFLLAGTLFFIFCYIRLRLKRPRQYADSVSSRNSTSQNQNDTDPPQERNQTLFRPRPFYWMNSIPMNDSENCNRPPVGVYLKSYRNTSSYRLPFYQKD